MGKYNYIGIDPGVSGAITVLNHRAELLLNAYLPVRVGNRNKKVLDVTRFDEFLIKYHQPNLIVRVLIEDVWGMPTMGSNSSFSFGHMAGSLVAVLIYNEFPYEFVTPNKWKKHFGLIKSPKSGSIDRVREYYPDIAFSKKKDHNLADSILIARYLWERYK